MNNNIVFKLITQFSGFVRLRMVYFLTLFGFLMISAVYGDQNNKAETGRVEQNDYLGQIQINRSENYLESTIRKFRSFPHLDKAYRLMDSNRFSEAKQEFRQYLEIDPLDIKARMAYIILLYQLKDYREVIQQSGLALKQRDDVVPIFLYRGLARNASSNREGALADFNAVRNNNQARLEDKRFALNMSVFILLEAKAYVEALRLLDQFPGNLQDYDYFMRSAMAKEGIKDFNSARQYYKQALSQARSKTDSINAYNAMGVIYQKQKMPADALNAFQSALNLNPDNPDLLRSVAYLFYNINQFDKAIDMMNKVLRQRFNDNDQEFVANIYFSNQDYLSAARSYEKLLWKQTEDKDKYRAYMLLGYSYSKANQQSMAIEAFQNASEIKQSSKTLQSLAYAFETNDDIEQAIRMYHNLSNKYPSVETYVKLSNLYIKTGENEKAESSLDSAIQLGLMGSQKKDVYQSYMLLGYSYSQADQQPKAIEAFQHASEINQSGDTLQSLAYALEKKGDVEEAIKIYQDLLQYSPKSETHIKLSNLYVSAGDKDNALLSLKSAQQLGLTDNQKKNVYRSQGELFYQAGQYTKAKIAFKNAALIDPIDSVLLNSLALTSIKLGELQDASNYLKKSLELGESVDALFSLAEVEKSLNNWEQPVQIYRHLLQLRGLNAEQKSQALTNLGLLYLDRDQQQLAIGYLRAAAAKGKQTWELNRYLGTALSKFERWDEALEQFELALSKHKSSQNMLNVARAYRSIDSLDNARTYYNGALKLAGSDATQVETKQILDELGYLHASQKQNHEAEAIWEKSLALEDDPVIEMRLAMLADSKSEEQAALIKLESINNLLLTSQQNAERLDFLAQLYVKKQLFSRAIDVQKNALSLQETPARHHFLGSFYQSKKQKRDALTHLKAAVDLDPDNRNYAKALAYAYSANNQIEQSAELLENIIEKEPENLDLHKDLAYLNLRNANNDEAEYWFKQAIDVRLAQLDDRQQNAVENDQEIATLRKEVREINNNFNFTAYSSYRQNNNTENSTGTPGSLGGVIPSQGGVEVSYRPPVIGLRDRRTLTVFSRLLWSMEPDSFKVDSDSFQGSVGVSYKPFKSQNFFVSTEKLFKVGKSAQNNWLIRGLYGWTNGFDLNFGEQYWNYTTMFGDLGYFVKSPEVLSFYGEARQGVSYNLWNSLVLTPHAVIDGRIQTNDASDVSYMEAGGGVSLKYFFNQTRYQAPKSYFELLFQYKAGVVNIDSGFNATGILRF